MPRSQIRRCRMPWLIVSDNRQRTHVGDLHSRARVTRNAGCSTSLLAKAEEHQKSSLEFEHRHSLKAPRTSPVLLLRTVAILSIMRWLSCSSPFAMSAATGTRIRGVDVRGGERADRQGVRCPEAIILNDERRPRLTRIHATSHGDDVPASHASQSSDTASTKSISALARSAAATSSDCRRASSANSGKRIGHPDLDRSKTLRPHSGAVGIDALTNGHANMLHVTLCRVQSR